MAQKIPFVSLRHVKAHGAIGLVIRLVPWLAWSSFAFAATFNIANGDITGLRSAITTSNSNGQDDVINLAVGGTYTFTDTDNNALGVGPNALPLIVSDNGHTLTINGNGSTFVRSSVAGTPDFRFLDLFNSANLTLNNLTFSNGLLVANSDSNAVGGAIDDNYGQVSINNCTLSGNSAGEGGAIYAYGVNSGKPIAQVTLSGCTLTGNHAQNGAGIYINGASLGAANLNAVNCTFTGNIASGGASLGSSFYTNAVEFGSVIAHITACTIFQEETYNDGGSVSFASCILEPHGNQTFLNGTVSGYSSNGYNLTVGNGFGNFNATGDQNVASAQLDPRGLRDNGGPTLTIAPRNGSPAIDKGKAFGSITTDQRGNPRPVDLASIPNAPGGDGSDIGAYETTDPVQANPLVVNSTDDHDDGVCGGIDCTLREAISYGNNFGNSDITFAPGLAGTITLQPPLGTLTISATATITGPGARQLAISGNHQLRIFNLNSETTISGLTIRDGAVSITGNVTVGGAAIGNQALLRLKKCQLIGSTVVAGNGVAAGSNGGTAEGGAVINNGTLDVDKCLFSGNSVTGGNGASNNNFFGHGGTGGAGQGGAIYNSTGANALVVNTTFYNNMATGGTGGTGGVGRGGAGGNGSGGGIANDGTMTVTSCTVASNAGMGGAGSPGNLGTGAAGIGSGGLANISGTTTIFDSIAGDNNRNNGGGVDVDGAFISGGNNLIATADHSTGFPATGDITGTDAMPVSPRFLYPPSNTGGPTDTLRFFGPSPAIHAASPATSPERDQRGYIRDYAPDMGAYETNGGLLKLSSFFINNGAAVLDFEVVEGHTYHFERKLDITAASWSSTADPDLIASDDDEEQFADTLFMSPKAFYHVVVVQ